MNKSYLILLSAFFACTSMAMETAQNELRLWKNTFKSKTVRPEQVLPPAVEAQVQRMNIDIEQHVKVLKSLKACNALTYKNLEMNVKNTIQKYAPNGESDPVLCGYRRLQTKQMNADLKNQILDDIEYKKVGAFALNKAGDRVGVVCQVNQELHPIIWTESSEGWRKSIMKPIKLGDNESMTYLNWGRDEHPTEMVLVISQDNRLTHAYTFGNDAGKSMQSYLEVKKALLEIDGTTFVKMGEGSSTHYSEDRWVEAGDTDQIRIHYKTLPLYTIIAQLCKQDAAK